MKKLICIVIAALMLLSLTACGSGGTDNKTAEKPGETTAGSQETEKIDMKQQEQEGDLGDYHVKFVDFTPAKDYEGKDVIVVNWEFTNNSEDTTSADVAVYIKAFQNGVELDPAYVDLDGADNSMKDIRPGTTLDIHTSFVLADTSTVEFEATELISFSDDMVVTTYAFEAE